jgi:hypothetical protein
MPGSAYPPEPPPHLARYEPDGTRSHRGQYLLVDDYPAIVNLLLKQGADEERERVEAARCESCDDTGIYEEGDEWAPCGECDRGRALAEYFKTARGEAREEERERLKEKLEELPCFTPDSHKLGAVEPSDVGEYIERDAAIAALDNQEASDG